MQRVTMTFEVWQQTKPFQCAGVFAGRKNFWGIQENIFPFMLISYNKAFLINIWEKSRHLFLRQSWDRMIKCDFDRNKSRWNSNDWRFYFFKITIHSYCAKMAYIFISSSFADEIFMITAKMITCHSSKSHFLTWPFFIFIQKATKMRIFV